MKSRFVASDPVLDLTRVPPDHRAEKLAAAFRLLRPGEALWVTGQGNVHHYERFLHHLFPGEVEWLVDFDFEGDWIARVGRG